MNSVPKFFFIGAVSFVPMQPGLSLVFTNLVATAAELAAKDPCLEANFLLLLPFGIGGDP